jgi:hypothetical protein
MDRRLSWSHAERSPDDIAVTHDILTQSVMKWLPEERTISVGMTYKEIRDIRELQLTEVEKYTCLDILSAIEAVFRIDYAVRCEEKYKDDVAFDFRTIYKQRGMDVRFIDDILRIWGEHNPQNVLINEIKKIFQYRHRLTHGRYWLLKVNTSKYDFDYLYMLFVQITDAFQLLN